MTTENRPARSNIDDFSQPPWYIFVLSSVRAEEAEGVELRFSLARIHLARRMAVYDVPEVEI